MILDFIGSKILHSPQPTARQKYSEEGWYKPEVFTQQGISTEIATILSRKANHGLAMTSWKSYASAINNIKKCNYDLECNIKLPFSIADTLTFIGWILSQKLKASTANKYLCGIRQWHLCNGFDEPLLRSPLVKQVLNGAANFDALNKVQPKKNRLPITITAMKLLNRLLNKLKWAEEKKTRVWFTACLAWAGSFRIHEILSKEKKKFLKSEKSFLYESKSFSSWKDKKKHVLKGIEMWQYHDFNIKKDAITSIDKFEEKYYAVDQHLINYDR